MWRKIIGLDIRAADCMVHGDYEEENWETEREEIRGGKGKSRRSVSSSDFQSVRLE